MARAFFGEALFILYVLTAGTPASAQNHQTWSDYGGAADSAQYSGLSQINRSNVGKLEVALALPDRR